MRGPSLARLPKTESGKVMRPGLEVETRVDHANQLVRVHFGPVPLNWIALPREEALELARLLLSGALNLRTPT